MKLNSLLLIKCFKIEGKKPPVYMTLKGLVTWYHSLRFLHTEERIPRDSAMQ